MAGFSHCFARAVVRFAATWRCKIALMGDFGLAQNGKWKRQSEYPERQSVYQKTKAYEKASGIDEMSML